MIKSAIFDVDGTLIDSMPVWHNCGVRYLKSIGIKAEPGLGDFLFTQTNQSGAIYMVGGPDTRFYNCTLTNNSGALVPKATTVKPTTKGDIPKRTAKDELPFTRKSAPK